MYLFAYHTRCTNQRSPFISTKYRYGPWYSAIHYHINVHSHQCAISRNKMVVTTSDNTRIYPVCEVRTSHASLTTTHEIRQIRHARCHTCTTPVLVHDTCTSVYAPLRTGMTGVNPLPAAIGHQTSCVARRRSASCENPLGLYQPIEGQPVEHNQRFRRAHIRRASPNSAHAKTTCLPYRHDSPLERTQRRNNTA